MMRPSVVFQPRVNKYLLRGVDLIASAIRPTLGPRPRYVAYESVMRTKTPEMLSDAGTLARRIIQVSDDPSDLGAMLMRQAVWQVSERVGDGTATTAVLTQAMLHEAARMVAAGANAMRVRDGIRLGVQAAVQALREQATPVSAQEDLTRIAHSYCHDDGLARLLGEIYSIVGEGGYVEVQASNGRTLEREYVEGAFWRNTGWISSAFADKSLRRAELQDAAVMMVDGRINDVAGLARAMAGVMNAGYTSICIVCRGMSEAVISVLAHNHVKGTFKCLPINSPATSTERKAMFDDMRVLMGGTVLAMGDDADMTLFTPDMIGRVRRIWADPTQSGLVAGKGSPRQLREHIALLRRSLRATQDKDEIAMLHKRLGRLMGGTAVIQVGAHTEAEQKLRQAMAERSVRYMHSVSEWGLLPGGGAAFLACQSAVEAVESADDDVRAGLRAVVRALEEPMRAIAGNAGLAETTTVAQARRCGPGYGVNVLTGEFVPMRAAGIVDSANVAEQAIITSGSVTSMLLTTDVVVRHRKPETATEP
jgi:chaperonin GroEL